MVSQYWGHERSIAAFSNLDYSFSYCIDVSSHQATILFFFFFPENRNLTFHANNLHEMSELSEPIVLKKVKKKTIMNLSSAEFAQIKVHVTVFFPWQIRMETSEMIHVWHFQGFEQNTNISPLHVHVSGNNKRRNRRWSKTRNVLTTIVNKKTLSIELKFNWTLVKKYWKSLLRHTLYLHIQCVVDCTL